MPDFFSYFTPKKLAAPEYVEDHVGESDLEERNVVNKQDLIIDEGDVDGILNENFNHCCDLGHAIDLSSVESLSTALLKLETEKESLENEIQQQYDRMNITELADILTRIRSVTHIQTDIEDEESKEEIEQMMELLKSTASFVERRLRKIKIKTSSTQPENLQDTLPLSSLEEHNICVTTVAVSQDGDARLSVEEEDDKEFISSTDEGNQSEIDKTEEDNGHKEDITDETSNEIIDDDGGSGAVDDCDGNLEDESDPNEDDHLQDLKSKFGSKRTRWSIRKVFKKNF